MTLSAARVRPGPTALSWLGDRIGRRQFADALAPVTVVSSTHYVGLWLRNHWAESAYANVRTTILPGLAELLGAPPLGRQGRTPLTVATEEALIREAIAIAGAGFGTIGHHPALVQALRSLFRELDEEEVSAPLRQEMATQSLMAASAFATFDAYHLLLERHRLYTPTELLAAATERLTADDCHDPLREIGMVLVYQLQRLSSAEARFLRALGGLTEVEAALPYLADAVADSGTQEQASRLGFAWNDLETFGRSTVPANKAILVVADAAEEVRSVIRQILADLEAGVSLHDIAIVFRSSDPYGPLVRETLRAAGLPWAALEGLPLSESYVGLSLLALLKLPDADFARTAVMSWLSAIPRRPTGRRSVSEWDRLSREAGVVKGAAQWEERLRLLAQEMRKALEELNLHEEASEGHRWYLQHRAEAAEDIASSVEELARETTPPAAATWPQLAAWANHLREKYSPSNSHWPQEEQDAADRLKQILDGLTPAGALEDVITADTFVQAFEDRLRSSHRPEGRLGVGITIGSTTSIIGMAFSRVYVLGVTERAYPSPLPVDPIVAADAGADPLGRRARRGATERQAFLASLAAPDDGVVQLSFPAWDPDLRPAYPSGWLLDVAEQIAGKRVSSAELRKLQPESWLRVVPSPEAGIAGSSTPLNLSERRSLEARDWVQSGQRLERAPLAQRTDLPLGRNLQVQAARWANTLTPFDGNLAEAAALSSRLSNGLGDQSVSASAIELWAYCPFRYFLAKVLKVEATNRPERDRFWSISPLVKGSLIHDILERFFNELRANHRPAPGELYTPADHDRLQTIAFDEFAQLEERGETGYRLAWENDRAAIVMDLHTFLARDQELRAGGFLPAYFEQSFGMRGESWPAPTMMLSGGRTIAFRGFIDRIDLAPSLAAPQQARILDYKTGKTFPAKELKSDPTAAGTRVQLAAYSLALREHFRQLALPDPTILLAYWFIGSKGEFAFRDVPDEPAAVRLADVVQVVDEGIRAGAFIQVPGDEGERPGASGWENCFYCEYNRVCPTARDQVWNRKKDAPTAAIHLRLQSSNGPVA